MKIEDMVVKHNGNSNVIDALDAIVEGNLRVMNPIVVVGESGTGKSYILKALQAVLVFSQGVQEVRHMRCEEFVDLYIEALSLRTVADFRNRMTRGVTTFLLDDIDYLIRMTAAAFELTQLIEAFMNSHVRIVLTSSVPIKDLRMDIATKQFGSKIAEGVELDLSYPDAEGRKDIISNILNRARVKLPRVTIEDIAESADGDLHCLVGQVHKAMIDARLNRTTEVVK